MRRAAACAALALLLVGCEESAEQNTFIVRVSSINDGGPLLADVIAYDDQDRPYVPTDVVTIELTNRPYSSSVVVDPGTLWYDFQVRSVSVRWRRNDGGPTAGAGWNLSDFDHTQTTSALVPFNGSATFGALLVPVAMKVQDPFGSLAMSGGVIALTADIDIVGSPAIDGSDEIHIPASLSVTFANFADEQ